MRRQGFPGRDRPQQQSLPSLHRRLLRRGQEAGFHQATPGPQDALQGPFLAGSAPRRGALPASTPLRTEESLLDPLPSRGVVGGQAEGGAGSAFPPGLLDPVCARATSGPPLPLPTARGRAWGVDAGVLASAPFSWLDSETWTWSHITTPCNWTSQAILALWRKSSDVVEQGGATVRVRPASYHPACAGGCGLTLWVSLCGRARLTERLEKNEKVITCLLRRRCQVCSLPRPG